MYLREQKLENGDWAETEKIEDVAQGVSNTVLDNLYWQYPKMQ